jgi:hypothetical protein
MKNKWWRSSGSKQNTTSKHKNFTIIPLILREIDIDKTLLGDWIQNFQIIYEEQFMAHIQNHTQHDFET